MYDEDGTFHERCNQALVSLETITEAYDRDHLKSLLLRHIRETGSQRAREIINAWDESTSRFVKVVPIEYRAALARQTHRGA